MDNNSKMPSKKLTNQVNDIKKPKQSCITRWTVPAAKPAPTPRGQENVQPIDPPVNPKWWLQLPEPPKKSINGALRRSYHLVEDRIMLTYLISKGIIHSGTGRKTWELMKADGYLTDRTTESLSNRYRRKILLRIEKYKLPKNLEEDFIKCRENYLKTYH